MTPSAIESSLELLEHTKNGTAKSLYLKSSGFLDAFKSDDLTPVIGTEFPEANIVDDFLDSKDSEQRLKDLAIRSVALPDDRSCKSG